MKIIALIAGLSLAIAGPSVAGEAFPVENSKYLAQGKFEPAALLGRIVAIEGTLVEITPGPDGSPLLKLQVDGQQTMWAYSLAKLDHRLKAGHKLRVWGPVSGAADAGPEVVAVTDGSPFVSALCLYSATEKFIYYLPAAYKHCQAWHKGVIHPVTQGAP